MAKSKRKYVTLPSSLRQEVDAILAINPTLSFSTVTQAALEQWVKNPVIEVLKSEAFQMPSD